MTCQVTTFMQILLFVFVFEERYFIMVIGLGDGLFCFGFRKRSNTCLKSCVWIFSTWIKTNTFSVHLDSHKWFIHFENVIFSVFPTWLIRMDFLRHIMKVEFHGYQIKGVYIWCLRIFMGLGSLLLLFALSSSFYIHLAYVMLSKIFAFRSWHRGSF